MFYKKFVNLQINSVLYKFGFTLAEVLIVLGIVGIIAEMTIPALINDTKEQIYKTAYKKSFSVISQAFTRALGDNALIYQSGTYGSQGAEANFATIRQYISASKQCTTTTLSECWNTNGEVWKQESSNVPSFIDKSGMAWRLRQPDSANLHPSIFVDTNGHKGPNQYGLDRFTYFFGYIPGDVNANANMVGVPNRILVQVDITDVADAVACPSVAKHPCYNTSWLFNGH